MSLTVMVESDGVVETLVELVVCSIGKYPCSTPTGTLKAQRWTCPR